MGPYQVGKETWILRDSAKILSGEMGEPERRKHRTKETANMLHMQDQLPIGGSHEEPREEGPQGTQASGNKGGKEQEFRRKHRDDVPDVQEELHEPKNDETTYEDSTRGDAGVTDMQRMREKVPDQVDTTGASENQLRGGKELRRKIKGGSGVRRERGIFFSRGE